MKRWGIAAGSALGLVVCVHAGVSAQSKPSACSVAGPVFFVGGMMDPDHVFGDISDAALLPDSTVAVLDRQARHVQVFDRSGRLVRTLGREGEGPGEFLDPIQVEASGNTLAVWDWRIRRVTLFDLANDSVRTISISLLNPHGRFGRRSSGDFAFSETTRDVGPREQASWMHRMAVVVTSPSGADQDTLVRIADREARWVDRSARRIGFPVFTPSAEMAVSAGTIWIARGDSARLVRIGAARVDTVRWDWPLRRVEAEDVRRHQERILNASHPTRRRLWEREFEIMPVSEFFPAVSDLASDDQGGVWVGAYRRLGDPLRRWARVEQGGVTCELDLPASFTILAGAKTWILGVAKDEFDVERVELWSVDRARR